ncbi:MAG: DUF1822 family protein [Limnoraphis robusta]
MNTQQLFGQLIPIPQKIREYLGTISRQIQPSQLEEIYQRAIAVWVVHRYLKRFDYQSDFRASSAWNIAAQVLTDFADLEIFEDSRSLGIVECIPMAADADSLEISEAANQNDRIAYIGVEINPENTWGRVVGFTPALETRYPELSIDREDLLEADRLLDLLEIAEPLADESRFSELESYLGRENWSVEQRQATIAKLERALLLETLEPLQIESAAQELEALMAESTASSEDRELLFVREENQESAREETEDRDRTQLREILQRIIQSLREELE